MISLCNISPQIQFMFHIGAFIDGGQLCTEISCLDIYGFDRISMTYITQF